jgi:hypothetical protein
VSAGTVVSRVSRRDQHTSKLFRQKHVSLLTVTTGCHSQRHRPTEPPRVDVVARTRVRAIDAHNINVLLVERPHVGSLRVRPRASELHVDGPTRRQSPILHLHTDEHAVPVTDQVERCVLAERRENDKPLIGQIGNRVCDAKVALVLRVMRPHDRQSSHLSLWAPVFLVLPSPRSSAGQSESLLMTRSQVRVLPGARDAWASCLRTSGSGASRASDAAEAGLGAGMGTCPSATCDLGGVEHEARYHSARTRAESRTRMVAVAQSVRAPGCGPGGRGFDSPRSPHCR